MVPDIACLVADIQRRVRPARTARVGRRGDFGIHVIRNGAIGGGGISHTGKSGRNSYERSNEGEFQSIHRCFPF